MKISRSSKLMSITQYVRFWVYASWPNEKLKLGNVEQVTVYK